MGVHRISSKMMGIMVQSCHRLFHFVGNKGCGHIVDGDVGGMAARIVWQRRPPRIALFALFVAFLGGSHLAAAWADGECWRNSLRQLINEGGARCPRPPYCRELHRCIWNLSNNEGFYNCFQLRYTRRLVVFVQTSVATR